MVVVCNEEARTCYEKKIQKLRCRVEPGYDLPKKDTERKAVRLDGIFLLSY